MLGSAFRVGIMPILFVYKNSRAISGLRETKSGISRHARTLSQKNPVIFEIYVEFGAF